MGTKHVIDGDDLPWDSVGEGEHFALKRRRLGKAAGGRALGCSLCEIEPGKTAWPFHYHLANEEAVYVLAGQATLRLGDERVTLTEGDYVALPPDEDLAHQITNTGDKPFRYLAISTMLDPDVVYYPDSKKIGTSFGFFKTEDEVGYWEGEPVGDPEKKIDEELEELREKIQADPSPPRKKTFRERVEEKVEELKRTVGERLGADDDAEEEALERQIDDEIEQLKKKLKL